MSDELCQDDAAYVVGALSPTQRARYRTHLDGCDECQRSVRELAGLPGLLAKVRPEDFDVRDEPVPVTLLTGLVARVNDRRRRHRWIGAAVAITAAVAAPLVVATVDRTVPPQQHQVAAVAMTDVVDTPVQARARLTDEPWGTQIDLFCTYDRAGPYGRQPQTYVLVVTDRAGTTSRVAATWKVVAGGVSTVTGSVSWPRADISEVEVRTLAGSAVLRLTT